MAPEIQLLTQSGSEQWRHETAKLIGPCCSMRIPGKIHRSFKARDMSLSRVAAKAQ
jgi:hypothetical protein